jgi:hypothetical protein
MQFPHRTWIACAGIGEYGTSGGAWFLANKWEEIRKRAGSGPFAVIVRVRPGQDESATPILTATCADDLRSFVADGEIAEEYAPASIAQPAAMAELLGSGSIVTTSQSFPTLTAPASGTVTPRSGGSEAPSGPALPPRDPKKRGK